MIEQIGYILLAFFIAYLAFEGVLAYLEEDFGIKIATGEKLFISENEGEDWQALNIPTKERISGKNLAFDPKDSRNLYLASAKGIFQSKTQGEKFTSQKTAFKTETEPALISEFISDPQRPNTIYLISKEIGRNKILVSDDQGKNFRPIFISEKDDRISSFAIDPLFSRFLYAGTKRGLFLESEDFGNSWRKGTEFPQGISQIAPSPYREGEIYVLLTAIEEDPFDYWSRRIPGKLMITKNRGADFVELEKVNKFAEIKEIVFDPNTEARVYFISDSLLLKSWGGNKIEIVKVVSSSEDEITAFTIDPKNSNILYLGTEGLIYKSENGGEDWEIIEPPIRGEIQGIKINPVNTEIILLSIKKIL